MSHMNWIDSHIHAVQVLRPKVEMRVQTVLADTNLGSADRAAIIMGVEAMIRRSDTGDLSAATRRALESNAIEHAVAAALAVPTNAPWWQVRNARFSAALRCLDTD